MKKLSILILALTLAAPSNMVRAAIEAERGYVDVHMHLDGVQRGGQKMQPPPIPSHLPPKAKKHILMKRQKMMQMRQQQNQADGGVDAAATLIDMMNAYGLENAIVMPPPQHPKQTGGYDYTALLDIVSANPNRLILGGGGGTLNPMIQSVAPERVTQLHRDKFSAQVEELISAGVHVFGEMTAMHLCMNPKHSYSAAAPDHPLFLMLADFSAEYGIPIDLHMEAIPNAMNTPTGLLDACSQNPLQLPATIPGVETLLAHNPEAKIVWQHIGWDNTSYMTPNLIRTLLSKYTSLYIAIKGVPTGGKSKQYNHVFDIKGNGEAHDEWLELFRNFPDRIVVGADEFARADGQQGGYKKPPFFEMTWEAIHQLPLEIREQIGGENARRLYNL